VNERIQEISQLDRLIHEPARLKILLILQAVGEADFLYLQRDGDFTQGNLSTHLNKLEGAAYVEIEKKFKGKVPLTVCRLTAAGERALLDYSRRMLGILNPDGASANPPRKQRP
jgi:DNA-binding transcriptional ArsR family regulator